VGLLSLLGPPVEREALFSALDSRVVHIEDWILLGVVNPWLRLNSSHFGFPSLNFVGNINDTRNVASGVALHVLAEQFFDLQKLSS